MKVVQQLTCLTLGRPNGPAYSTGKLLNTLLVYTPHCIRSLNSITVKVNVDLYSASPQLPLIRYHCSQPGTDLPFTSPQPNIS